MSAKRREKFQDSNALIQLSRQLRAKQAVHEVTTRHIHKDAASKVQQLSQRAGTQTQTFVFLLLVAKHVTELNSLGVSQQAPKGGSRWVHHQTRKH